MEEIIMSWIYLLLAGICEIGWAVGMKYSNGFTKFWPSAVTVIFMLISVILLAAAIKTLPLGTAYAIWTGIGAIGTVIAGIILFGDAASAGRILCILMITGGIIGLKVITK